MIVPSIDIMDGRAVQLVGGKDKAIDAGDPRPIAQRFARAGELAVIDLDAALGRGSNAELVGELVRDFPCRVGGGIRDVEMARRWLDRGAAQVILGTAARPEVLRELPRDRVIAALDADAGEVVDQGWTRRTGATVEQRMAELRDLVGGFLVTFVEREGRMGGLPMERVRALRELAGDAALTVAGGVRTPSDVGEADALGVDAQVGMALYTGSMSLGSAVAACLRSDRPDGLWPTVVCDERGVALGLVYSNAASLGEAIDTGMGVYWSRSRGALWRKGASSGNVQELLRVEADCDRDALRFTVRQAGDGFCHNGTRTCFGGAHGVDALARTIAERCASAPAGSYTRKLFDDPALLAAKLREEADELLDAHTPGDAAAELADVLYFALAAAAARGATLADAERELDRRRRRVSRRSATEANSTRPRASAAAAEGEA